MGNNRKIYMLPLFFCYIIANMMFYNTFYKDYVNRHIFFVTLFFLIMETLFWTVLFYSVYKFHNKGKADTLVSGGIFLLGIIGTGIERIFLNSSPYMNDMLTANDMLILIFGSMRVLSMFSAILLIFYVASSRNILLICISALNGVVSVMIWLDFDGPVSSAMRIITGILMIIYTIIIFKEREKLEVIHEKKTS